MAGWALYEGFNCVLQPQSLSFFVPPSLVQTGHFLVQVSPLQLQTQPSLH